MNSPQPVLCKEAESKGTLPTHFVSLTKHKSTWPARPYQRLWGWVGNRGRATLSNPRIFFSLRWVDARASLAVFAVKCGALGSQSSLRRRGALVCLEGSSRTIHDASLLLWIGALGNDEEALGRANEISRTQKTVCFRISGCC